MSTQNVMMLIIIVNSHFEFNITLYGLRNSYLSVLYTYTIVRYGTSVAMAAEQTFNTSLFQVDQNCAK